MKSKKITESARGEDCTINIAGVCNYNPETVVFCHINFEGGAMGMKSSDVSGAYGCSDCHDAIDRRVYSSELEDDRWFYLGRAMQRTTERLYEKGVIHIKGAK